MAVQKKAPKVFTTCTKDGLPWVAVIPSGGVIFAGFRTAIHLLFCAVVVFFFGIHERGSVISNSLWV